TTHISGGTVGRQAKGLAGFFQLGAKQN
nr:envelope protein 2 variant 624 [Hepacivirus hominis]